MTGPQLRLPGLPPIQIHLGTVIGALVLAALIHPTLDIGAETGAGAHLILAAAIAVFILLSVLFHELAHAVVARLFGAEVDHIALTLLGGHTQYQAVRMPHLASMLVSLAGPATNLVLAGLTWAAANAFTPQGMEIGQSPDPTQRALLVFLLYATFLNLALAIFNLLPGLPMDGGRALESLLAAVLPRRRIGTVITAWIGRGIAVAVVLWPLSGMWRSQEMDTSDLLILLWAVLIAGMLWSGASQALSRSKVEERVEHLRVRSLLAPADVLGPETTVAEIVARPRPDRVLILTPQPGLRGQVALAAAPNPRAVQEAAASGGAGVPAGAVSSPIGTVGLLAADLEGHDLVDAMLAQPHAAYLVVEADGAVLGVVLSQQVNEALHGA